MGIFSAEPDYVSRAGVKWWRDREATSYARHADALGTCLDAACFAVESLTGERTRLLVSADGRLLAEERDPKNLQDKIDLVKELQRMFIAPVAGPSREACPACGPAVHESEARLRGRKLPLVRSFRR